MKQHLEQLFSQAVQTLIDNGTLPQDAQPRILISRPKDPQHGDFACNVAMMLAKAAGMNPRVLAQHVIDALPASDRVENISIAGPGFINLFQAASNLANVVTTITQQAEQYGRCHIGNNLPVQVEFVSANPTGPLHVGHGRGAAYGAALSNLLRAAGYDVSREYYVNDAGRQMDILATSVWLRYLEQQGESFTFPSNGYKGDYIQEIAAQIDGLTGEFQHTAEQVFVDITADEPQGGDKEQHIDDLIDRAKTLLGAERYRAVFDLALDNILGDIRDDLGDFRVHFEEWFSERSLTENGHVKKALDVLTANGHIYEQKGALWFRSSDFGDEKDRVVVRDNGQTTYFASDIAYLLNKIERGFERLVYVWGADHHGYVPRMKAAAQALGVDPDKLQILLVQFAILYRDGERLQMSTRSGQFVTLRELREEVGADAARFFYVMRRCEQHLDFDLDLAKRQSNDNPVYYIQYAHARICSVFRQLDEKSLSYDANNGLANLSQLTTTHETELMTALSRYPEVIENAAKNEEPHQLTNYLRELSQAFHTYYNAQQFLVEENDLRDARLALCKATQQVLINGLDILDVSAPEEM